jgi:hypothetical protein
MASDAYRSVIVAVSGGFSMKTPLFLHAIEDTISQDTQNLS